MHPSRELGSALRAARLPAAVAAAAVAAAKKAAAPSARRGPAPCSCRFRRTTSGRAAHTSRPARSRSRSRWTAPRPSRRTFEVRADPASAVTLAQHKAREAFVIEVMDLQAAGRDARVESRRRAARRRPARARRGCRRSSSGSWAAAVAVAAAAAAAARQAAAVQPLRQRLTGLINAFVGFGRAHRHARGPDGHHARRARGSEGGPQRDPGGSKEMSLINLEV